jgi:hypothetical protein
VSEIGEKNGLVAEIDLLIADADSELPQARIWERRNNEVSLGLLVAAAACGVLGATVWTPLLGAAAGFGGALLLALNERRRTHGKRIARVSGVKREARTLRRRVTANPMTISEEKAWNDIKELQRRYHAPPE